MRIKSDDALDMPEQCSHALSTHKSVVVVHVMFALEASVGQI